MKNFNHRVTSLNNFLDNFWKPPILIAFSVFYLSMLLIYVFFGFFSASGEINVREGDYPVFYAAGEIAGSNPESLYDLELQISKQELLSTEEGYHVFAYPPFFSLLFIPFSKLPPLASKLLFIFCGVLLTLGSVRCIKRISASNFPSVSICAFLFLFFPYLIGVVGGQNTAISLLLLLLIHEAYQKRSVFIMGILSALFSFKPQYGVFIVLFILLFERERVRFLLGYLSTLTLLTGISVLYFGKDIFVSWLSLMIKLGNLNQSNISNVVKMVSGQSVTHLLENKFGAAGLYSGIFLLLCIVLILGSRIIQERKSKDILLYMGAVIVFLSPQTGFYDSALLLPLLFSYSSLCTQSKFIWWYLLFVSLLTISFYMQMAFSLPFLTLLLMLVVVFISPLRPLRVLRGAIPE